MVFIDVTKLSSKGQIVIPRRMRKEFSIGEEFVIIKKGHDFILKPASEVGGNFVEDLDFAKETMKALERYKTGGFKEMNDEDFLSELEEW